LISPSSKIEFCELELRNWMIYQTDNERKRDFAEAERTFREMADVNKQPGYETSASPKAEPAARAQTSWRKFERKLKPFPAMWATERKAVPR
jgi:hypothetical protein